MHWYTNACLVKITIEYSLYITCEYYKKKKAYCVLLEKYTKPQKKKVLQNRNPIKEGICYKFAAAENVLNCSSKRNNVN